MAIKNAKKNNAIETGDALCGRFFKSKAISITGTITDADTAKTEGAAALPASVKIYYGPHGIHNIEALGAILPINWNSERMD